MDQTVPAKNKVTGPPKLRQFAHVSVPCRDLKEGIEFYSKVLGGDIKNFSANGYRRVDLAAQLAGSADVHKAIALLKESVARVANIQAQQGVDVEIIEFNEFGPKLAVRPYCHTDHYWQVYFDTNKTIADTLGGAGFPVATRPVKVYPV